MDAISLKENRNIALKVLLYVVYDINGQIYFGELTFFHYSGFTPFEPEEWDYTFGSWIQLPQK